MTIQEAIQNVLDNAAEGGYDSIGVKVDSYGCTLESFTYSYGSIDDVEINTDDADIEVSIDGDSPDEYYFVRRAAIDELAELDLESVVDAEVDPDEYVKIDSLREVLDGLVILAPADKLSNGQPAKFVEVSEIIARASDKTETAAGIVDEIVNAIEPSESETDSE